MTDAGVPADHPSIDTVGAHLGRYGPGIRVLAPVEASDRFAVDEVARVVVDGTVRYACPQAASDGAPFLPGVYDSPGAARDPSSRDDPVDWLAVWADERGLAAGDPVLIDVLSEGERYGLREPGKGVTYRERRERSDSLSTIARSLNHDE